MLEEFTGIPTHPLLVHVVVVLVPVLALLAAAYAVVPFVRPHTRWVLGLLALGTPVAALVTKLSGDAFFDRMDRRGDITEGFYPTIENHQDLGNLTLYWTIGLGMITLALVLMVAPRGASSRFAGWAGSSRALPLVLGALTLVAAAVSLYYVIRTGDSGARAVWEGK